MYCGQCGKEISGTSRFCGNCGYCVTEEAKNNSVPKHQSSFDAVEDIQKKLREIDSRIKPPVKKGDVIKSALNIVKRKTSALELVFGDNFESKKIEDKKQLILDYPLPTSSKALASFAKYIYSEIEAKKKEPDTLTEVWKEKLNQIHQFAETELSTTEEYAEIQKYHKAIKRRERHASIRELVVLLIFPILAAFIVSIIFQWPIMMFVSILAAGWEVFLILYVYDLLDDMVASMKQHGEKRQNVPKWLRSATWHLLMPIFAALITSIVYHSVVLIVIFAVLLGVAAVFLCNLYER